MILNKTSYLFGIRISGDNLWLVVNQIINDVVFPGDIVIALDRLEGLDILVNGPLRLLCLQGELWSSSATVLLKGYIGKLRSLN